MSIACLLIGWLAGWAAATNAPVYGGNNAPPVYGSSSAIRCTCDTTTSFSAAIEASRLLLSVNPTVISSWLQALNPTIPGNATFLCNCSPQPVPRGAAGNYILAANQTDSTATAAPDCLGVQLLKEICDGLNVLSLFQCETIWRSGVSGIVADNLGDLEVLLTAVEKLCASRGGNCTRTIRFQLLEDAILAPTHY